MNIRVVTSDDAERFQAVRVNALRETPKAFASSYEEEVDTPIEQIKQRMHASAHLATTQRAQAVMRALMPQSPEALERAL